VHRHINGRRSYRTLIAVALLALVLACYVRIQPAKALTFKEITWLGIGVDRPEWWGRTFAPPGWCAPPVPGTDGCSVTGRAYDEVVQTLRQPTPSWPIVWVPKKYRAQQLYTVYVQLENGECLKLRSLARLPTGVFLGTKGKTIHALAGGGCSDDRAFIYLNQHLADAVLKLRPLQPPR
jgi:hypothetical protein